jgi:hypothetical protein
MKSIGRTSRRTQSGLERKVDDGSLKSKTGEVSMPGLLPGAGKNATENFTCAEYPDGQHYANRPRLNL